jgi:membrane protein
MKSRSRRFFRPKMVIDLFVEAFRKWRADHPVVLAAGLSYFALISLTPTLILVTALMGHIWAHHHIRHFVLEKLVALTGADSARFIGDLLALTNGRGRATAFSFAVLYVAAGRIFSQIRAAMDIIWDIPYHEKVFWKTIVRSMFKNIFIMLGLAVFLFLFILSDAAAAAVSQYVNAFQPGFRLGSGLALAHFGVIFTLFTLLFAAIYKIIPDTPVAWGDVWGGALVTSALMAIGKMVMDIYIRVQSFKSLYGAASSLILLMVWIYFAAQIFFFGAEFAYAYAKKYGSLKGSVARRPSPRQR